MEQMVRTQLETNVLLKLEAKIGQNLNLFRSSMELNWSAEWEMWTKTRLFSPPTLSNWPCDSLGLFLALKSVKFN